MVNSKKIAACELAFDHGLVWIGVALSRAGEATADSLGNINAKQDVRPQVKHLLDRFNPDVLVVGRPRNIEANNTAQTNLAESFASGLRQFGRPVVMQDEFMSSQAADEQIDKRLPLHKQKQQRNALAAQAILEYYLHETS
ncbi:Holliday junction resolvase RuvX [Candidatus Saccharibacteria bacterium]|nr:Holliday junction resolvase RuvX [Candidatus Saccharibacteria bacterium]